MRRIAAIALAALLTPCLSARAGLIFSIESITVKAGSTGNSFDVNLTNTGSSAVLVHIFAFNLQLSTTNITLTDVTTDTSMPYIFEGHSLLGPDITITSNYSGAVVGGRDANVLSDYGYVAPGATVGLGHVFFNAGSATGPTALSFVSGTFVQSPVTGLSFTTSTGSITVTPQFSATPEPSSLAMAGGVALIGGGAWWRKRRRSVNA
jgi:hypothetical protein